MKKIVKVAHVPFPFRHTRSAEFQSIIQVPLIGQILSNSLNVEHFNNFPCRFQRNAQRLREK